MSRPKLASCILKWFTCEPFERTFSEARLSRRKTSTRYLKVTQRQIDDFCDTSALKLRPSHRGL